MKDAVNKASWSEISSVGYPNREKTPSNMRRAVLSAVSDDFAGTKKRKCVKRVARGRCWLLLDKNNDHKQLKER